MFKYLILALALTACQPLDNKPLLPDRDDKTFTVTLEVMTPEQVNAKCQSLGLVGHYAGCNAFNTATKECTIYVAPQRYQEDKERLVTMGHELWHCRYGKWHE